MPAQKPPGFSQLRQTGGVVSHVAPCPGKTGSFPADAEQPLDGRKLQAQVLAVDLLVHEYLA